MFNIENIINLKYKKIQGGDRYPRFHFCPSSSQGHLLFWEFSEKTFMKGQFGPLAFAA